MNDTFVGLLDGADSTFTLGDEIDGGAGTDTLRLISTETGADLSIADLSSVENLSLRTSAEIGDIELNGNAFASIEIDGQDKVQTGDASISEIANGTEVTVKNADFDGNDLGIDVAEQADPIEVTVRLENLDDADVFLDLDANDDGTSATDVVNLFLDGVENTDGSAYFYTSDAETFNVSVVSDSELEAIGNYYNDDGTDFGPATVNLVADADLSVGFWDLSDNSGVATTFNISGAGDVMIAEFDDGSSDVTVDGSAATGNLKLLDIDGDFVSVTTGSGDDMVETNAAATVVAAGAGKDTVIVGTNLTVANSNVDGGEGDEDVLSVAASVADDGTDFSANIAGFEGLAVTGNLNGTVDADDFDNVQSIDLQASLGGNSTITGVESGATVGYSAAADMGATLSVDMTDATDANTPNDTLNVELNADLDANDDFDVNLSVDGINIINVDATDSDNSDDDTDQADGYTLNLSNEENVSKISITGDRAVSYTASVEATALGNVDGSAAEGDLDIDLAAFSGTEGVLITTGAGNDMLVGSALSDILVGGAGDDNLRGDAPQTVVTAGVAQETVVTIANGENGDTFTIGSTTLTYGTATDADVVNALETEIGGGVTAVVTDAGGDTTGLNGTYTVTGAADGTAFTVPSLNTTNAPATGDVVTITLDGGDFDAGENINYQVNGGAVQSVNVAGLSSLAAATALANDLDSQLGITASVDGSGTITVTGPAGAGNDLTIAAAVRTDGAAPAANSEATASAAEPEVVTLTPGAGFVATETMSVQIGAQSYQVTWDTDLATSLANFVTLHEAAVEAQLGGTAALSVNGTSDALLLTGAADGSDITLNGTAVVDGDFTLSNTGVGNGTGEVSTEGQAAVTVTDNEVTVADATDESGAAGTDNQSLTSSTTAGTPEVTVGGQAVDVLTGGEGSDTFNFASGDSTEAMMDVITDFEAGAASADFDTLDLGSTTVAADVLLASQIDVAANSADATASTDIGAIIENGMIKLVGADAAEIDTLAEWIDVAEDVLAPTEVGAFEFDGSTYVVEEGDNIIKLDGTVDIVGISTTEDSDVIHIA